MELLLIAAQLQGFLTAKSRKVCSVLKKTLSYFARLCGLYFLKACGIGLLLFSASPAHADCTNPAGAESATRYDFTAHKLHYCNGTSWVEAGGGLNTALTSARIWVGNAANVATAVTLSGDATLSNTGVLTLAANSVTTNEIAADTITAADIAANAVTSSELASNAVLTTNISDNAVTTAKIAASAITNAEIANATIVATTKLSATGTKNSTTFLRGDNTWAAPLSGGGDAGAWCGRRSIKCQGTTVSYPSVSGFATWPCAGINITGTCSSGSALTIVCPSGYAGIELEKLDASISPVSYTFAAMCRKI